MFMTSQLTHVRNLFLKGHLDSFEFKQDKLYVSVLKTQGASVRFDSPYEVCVGYNDRYDWLCDHPCKTRELAWKDIMRSISSLEEQISEVQKDEKCFVRQLKEQNPYLTMAQIHSLVKMLKGE